MSVDPTRIIARLSRQLGALQVDIAVRDELLEEKDVMIAGLQHELAAKADPS